MIVLLNSLELYYFNETRNNVETIKMIKTSKVSIQKYLIVL